MKKNIDVEGIAVKAKNSRAILSSLSGAIKNRVLEGFKDNLIKNKEKILNANQKDIIRARDKNLSAAFIDRLTINAAGIDRMVYSIMEIIAQPDPIGQITAEWQRPVGISIKRVQTPIGVIAIIYESRPNVTADAGALSFKSGNPCILRSGADSINSCNEIYLSFRESILMNKLPEGCVQFINNEDRRIVSELLGFSKYIDVVVPRGGKDLVKLIQSVSTIPVFSHLEGIVHIYVDEDADPQKAFDVILNSKTRKVSICGAVECLLINKNFAKVNDLDFIKGLIDKNIEVRGDAFIEKKFGTTLASPDDWGKEYLDNIIACKLVDGIDQAVQHIEKFGSDHTDCIITENDKTAAEFFKKLDSSIILQNASTQFADGGEFGFGAEIGISTGKLHARGPIGLNQLTTFQYHVIGNGSVRA